MGGLHSFLFFLLLLCSYASPGRCLLQGRSPNAPRQGTDGQEPLGWKPPHHLLKENHLRQVRGAGTVPPGLGDTVPPACFQAPSDHALNSPFYSVVGFYFGSSSSYTASCLTAELPRSTPPSWQLSPTLLPTPSPPLQSWHCPFQSTISVPLPFATG